MLGVALETAIGDDPSLDGIPLPAFFRHSIDYVESHGKHSTSVAFVHFQALGRF